MQRQMTQDDISPADVLRVLGIFTCLASAILGALLLFVFPTACAFLGGFIIVGVGALMLLGLAAFIAGHILSRRQPG